MGRPEATGKLQNTFLKSGTAGPTFSRQIAEELIAELKKATLVDPESLPVDVVRLNSAVTIRDEKEKKLMQVKLLTPGRADIKQRLISVLSSEGTALIGYRKGARIRWNVWELCIPLRSVTESRVIEEKNNPGRTEKIVLELRDKTGDAVYPICFFDHVHDLKSNWLRWRGRHGVGKTMWTSTSVPERPALKQNMFYRTEMIQSDPFVLKQTKLFLVLP